MITSILISYQQFIILYYHMTQLNQHIIIIVSIMSCQIHLSCPTHNESDRTIILTRYIWITAHHSPKPFSLHDEATSGLYAPMGYMLIIMLFFVTQWKSHSYVCFVQCISENWSKIAIFVIFTSIIFAMEGNYTTLRNTGNS